MSLVMSRGGSRAVLSLPFMALTLLMCGCADLAKLQVSAGTGPSPTLPAPRQALIPTVNIAPARGWPEGVSPTTAPGTDVVAFARDLNHPRWVHVLPNGDVLVAETNAPQRLDQARGIKGRLMGLVMERAGAAVPSANRILLLRDTTGNGVADFRSVLLSGLNSPLGMALIGDQLFIANTDAVWRFPYVTGDTQIVASGTQVVALPAGPLNHHWTKNLIANAQGSKLYVAVGSNSNAAENGTAAEAQRASIWEVDVRSALTWSLKRWCPTMRSVRILRHWGWHRPKEMHCQLLSPTACSWRNTARGIADLAVATRSFCTVCRGQAHQHPAFGCAGWLSQP